jgi:hypothetical protein
MRRGAAQEKIDAGIPTEGSGQKVAVLPEPREPLPGDKPGSQWSVKRRTDLVGNAKRGQPGATDVIKNQRPVVLEPREGTGYGGPRQWDPNAPPEPPEAGPTVGKGPIKSPSGNGSFKSNKVISQEGSHLTGAEKLPGYDDYVDALVEKGMDKNKAYQTADNDMKLANQPDYPNQSERQVSLDRIRRIMGPEQRGPVRLGPEARGIK